MISIIIPVFNGERYLRECIQSALDQDYGDKEIIVIDDGSMDKTKDILLEFDGINQVWKLNGGTASALNSGIKNSSGEWIKWLSADDVMYPNALSKFALADKPDTNAIYYTHYDRIDENGNILSEFMEPVRDESILWSFFYGNGSSSFIHKSVFEKCGLFDESLGHSEDYEFWLRATQVYGVKLRLLNFKSIKYRMHPEQLTNKVGGSLDEYIKKKIRGMING